MILLSLSLDCNQVGWNFIAACYQRCRPHRASLTDNWQIKTGINCFFTQRAMKRKRRKKRYLVQLFWNWKPWIEKLFDLKMKQTFQFRLKFWCEHTQPHMHTQQIFSKNYFLSLILEANEMRTRVSAKKKNIYSLRRLFCVYASINQKWNQKKTNWKKTQSMLLQNNRTL